MLTKLGKIAICANDKEINFITTRLPSKNKIFNVDGRYKLKCVLPQNTEKTDMLVKCIVVPQEDMKIDKSIETGESLALISFYHENFKLSIGTEGDRVRTEYQYLENGIQLQLKPPLPEVFFYVAWMTMHDREKQDIYTWFAADPAYAID